MIPVRPSAARDRQINRKSQKLKPSELQRMREMGEAPEQNAPLSARGGGDGGGINEMLEQIENANNTMA